jgi:hypothetical protein
VRQRGDRTGFAIEPLAHGGVGQGAGGHGLDRDVPPQPRVVRAIHLAHPAAADGLDDLVRSHLCTRQHSAPILRAAAGPVKYGRAARSDVEREALGP